MGARRVGIGLLVGLAGCSATAKEILTPDEMFASYTRSDGSSSGALERRSRPGVPSFRSASDSDSDNWTLGFVWYLSAASRSSEARDLRDAALSLRLAAFDLATEETAVPYGPEPPPVVSCTCPRREPEPTPPPPADAHDGRLFGVPVSVWASLILALLGGGVYAKRRASAPREGETEAQ